MMAGPYYQMGARYYHQSTGRFTQLDPLGSSIYDGQRYAYAGGEPCNRVDPTGLSWKKVAVTCVFALLYAFNKVPGLANVARARNYIQARGYLYATVAADSLQVWSLNKGSLWGALLIIGGVVLQGLIMAGSPGLGWAITLYRIAGALYGAYYCVQGIRNELSLRRR
jgi:hypothetical protein